MQFNFDQFEREGVFVVDRYLDSDLVEQLLTEFSGQDGPSNTSPQKDSSRRERRGSVFALRNLLSHDAIQTFVQSRAVQDFIQAIAPNSIAVRAILFDKTGDANWTVPWHQDRSIAVRKRIDVPGFGPWSEKAGVVHVQPPIQTLRQMFTLRFSLDRCDNDNGPLRAIPGTHNHLLDPKEVDETVSCNKQMNCTTESGGVVVMRPLILHASSPAARVGHRRILHIEFGPKVIDDRIEWALI